MLAIKTHLNTCAHTHTRTHKTDGWMDGDERWKKNKKRNEERGKERKANERSACDCPAGSVMVSTWHFTDQHKNKELYTHIHVCLSVCVLCEVYESKEPVGVETRVRGQLGLAVCVCTCVWEIFSAAASSCWVELMTGPFSSCWRCPHPHSDSLCQLEEKKSSNEMIITRQTWIKMLLLLFTWDKDHRNDHRSARVYVTTTKVEVII